jgi:DNA-binding winged helix-turn-helix (wHTH) protein
MTTESYFLEEYQFGPFCVDVRRRRLSREGDTIALPSRVFDLLVCLLRHQAEIVDKDALTRAGWADAFVTDDSLIHGISVLRKALGDDSSNPRFIVTLPRRGYQFIGTVQEVGAPRRVFRRCRPLGIDGHAAGRRGRKRDAQRPGIAP